MKLRAGVLSSEPSQTCKMDSFATVVLAAYTRYLLSQVSLSYMFFGVQVIPPRLTFLLQA